jgi:L-lactate dehydrogenase complex protein LldE
LRTEERGLEIGVDDAVPERFGDVRRRAEFLGARVVDQDVEAPEMSAESFDRSARRCSVADVADRPAGMFARGVELRRERRECVGITAEEADAGARGVQGGGEACADAAGAAGDERDLAVEGKGVRMNGGVSYESEPAVCRVIVSTSILDMSVQLDDGTLSSVPMTVSSHPPRVLLLPTCLVDSFRPQVGFAAADLLERAGCVVAVSDVISCCGQPAYNSGARNLAAEVARSVIAECERYDYVVIPSGSCAGMLRHHYPALLAEDANFAARATAVAARTHELTSFLTDVLGVSRVTAQHSGSVTYHDSCSGLREMGVRAQPRALLASVEGLELRESASTDVCCGFGGLFCVKYPDISQRMVDDKCAAVEASGADLLLGGDLGCLLNIAGRLSRKGSAVQVRHVAEVLVGGVAGAPILTPEEPAR